jgi:hypothetical protein
VAGRSWKAATFTRSSVMHRRANVDHHEVSESCR